MTALAPAAARWAPIAATQFQIGRTGAEGVSVELSDPGAAVRAAFSLRRLATPPDTGGSVRQPAVVISSPGGGRSGGLEAADAEGAIVCEERIWEQAGEAWVEARPDPLRSGSYLLGWQRSGGAEITAPRNPVPRSLAVSLSRPRAMLGRDGELVELAAAWKRAVNGSLSLELLAGEAGAGKTRLAAEAAREVQRSGGLVLHAWGGERPGGPYAPFAEALRPLLDPSPDANRTRDAELAGSLLGRVLDPARPPDRAGIQSGVTEGRTPFFRSAIEQIERISNAVPLLIVAEDLHAWGPSSLELLEHLTRAGSGMPVMIIATYRPTDLDPGTESAASITRLREIAGARHTELGGLGIVPMRGLAVAAGIDEGPERLDRVAAMTLEETAGNPLFALELLGSLDGHALDAAEGGAGGLAAPRSLQVLISVRARSLGEDAFGDLCAASVAGHSFDPELIAGATDRDRSALLESLALAERAGLVVAEGGGNYSFAHAVTSRSLYSELEPARRGELHRRIALELERREGSGPERASLLAHHWQQARPPEPERALRWAEEAGREALTRHDHGAAADWFGRAIEIHGSPGSPGGTRRRCELLIGLGTALRLRGEPRFRELLLEAARSAAELGETELLVEAVLANTRGFPSSIGEYDRERVALLELALERMPADSGERAAVLAHLALELTFSREQERRHRLAAEALTVARKSGDERLLARILISTVIARWSPSNARERIAHTAESIAISSRLDEPLDLFHGLHWQAAAQLEVMLVEDSARNLVTQARIAERLGDPTAEWLTACSEAVRVALRGRLDEAEGLATEAMSLGQNGAQPDALPFFASQIAGIRWQQGRLPELIPILTEALESHPGLPAFRSLLALAHALGGELEAGREVVDAAAATRFGELPLDPVWLAAVVTYAHAVAELGDPTHAAVLEDLLSPLAGRLATTSVSVWGTVDHALGRLAGLRGEGEAAEAHFARALADYRRISAPVWSAQAQLDRARAQLALGCGPGAVEPQLEEVRSVGRRYGAGLLLRVMDQRSEPRETDQTPPPGLTERIADLGLTERQAEVVEMLAGGLSNAAIARELEISPSTVKRHLENVFARLGLGSRGELISKLLQPAQAEASQE